MSMAAWDRLSKHSSYVRCRTFGHSWDDIPVTEPHEDGPSFWLRCVNCHMVRRDVFDARYGYLLHRAYDQPEGYSLAGEEIPTRDEFRLRLFTIGQDLADRRAKRNAS